MPMPKKKTRKVVKKPVQVQPASKAELQRAYQLVTKDLFSKLVKAKDKEVINIGSRGALGSFHKSERKVKSGIIPKGSKTKSRKLNTYVYFNVRFKPTKRLKEELNKPLVKKYQ
jgi:nucleoid DNA-binding protein